MTGALDPYHRWLGIAPKHQPADHYRLLGLERFEDDLEVIRDAAERQMAHVRRYQLGEHSALSQTILNELAAARACLLDPQKKAEYDQQLRAEPARPAQRNQAVDAPPLLPPTIRGGLEQKPEEPASTSATSQSWPARAAPVPSPGAASAVQNGQEAPGGRVAKRASRFAAELDRPLRQIAGEGNSPLHRFLRIAALVLPVILFVVTVVLCRNLFQTHWSHAIRGRASRGVVASRRTHTPPSADRRAGTTRSPSPRETTSPNGEALQTKSQASPAATVEAPTSPVQPPPNPSGTRTPSPSSSTPPKPGDVITNSIGMKLVLIPAGEFLMGSREIAASLAREFHAKAEDFADEHPQHRVRITKAFYLGVYEVTQSEWKRVMGTSPWSGKRFVRTGANYPATHISWDDAMTFCRRLTDTEHREACLPTGSQYALPTEAQWEYACGAGTTSRYHFGDNVLDLREYAWFRDNASDAGEKYAHQVGLKKPNAWGLYDMHGNVWEWCQDWYDKDFYGGPPLSDPANTAQLLSRVLRGGSWNGDAKVARTAHRYSYTPALRNGLCGFRVARSLMGNAPSGHASLVTNSGSRTAPKPTVESRAPAAQSAPGTGQNEVAPARRRRAVAPFDVITNSIGMKLVLIPAGEFLMGSRQGGQLLAREFGVQLSFFAGEMPRHRVRITKPFYLGMHEVTQGQWQRVMGTKPWRGKPGVRVGASYPAVLVSWNDAMQFCRKLTQREQQQAELASVRQYTLPTEAQWEYACRAGTTTRYCCGEDKSRLREYAWFRDNALAAGQRYGHRVGLKKPNAFGLYDMLGNVWEWRQDWDDRKFYAASTEDDPLNRRVARSRILRGGGWDSVAWCLRSANRNGEPPVYRAINLGFRVARTP